MNTATTHGVDDTTIDQESRDDRSSRDAARTLRRVTLLRVGILGAILVGALVLAYAVGWLSVGRALGWLRWLRTETSPGMAATIFIVLFAGLVAVGFPATPFLVAAGVAFGALRGTLLNMLGGALAATAGYWLSRTIARDAAAQLLGRRGKHLLARSTSFASILRLRLLPVIPMSAISFAAGIARVRFPNYLVASIIGTAASAWGFAYLADSIVSGAMGTSAVLWKIALACAVLLLLTIVPRLLARASAERSADHQK